MVRFLDEAPPLRKSSGEPVMPDATTTVTIEFRHVTFSYPGADAPALNDLNMTIAAGETAALIGKSGSGKTTVTNLLLRTLDPQRGHILINGTPVTELDANWIREQIALVPQDPFLFYGSIADNLRVARENASDDELLQALKDAELLDFGYSKPRRPRDDGG